MKRILAISVVGASLLAATGGQAAVEVRQSRNFNMSWSNAGNGVYVFAGANLDPVTGAVQSAYASYTLNSSTGYRYGYSNAVTVDMDPAGLQATVRVTGLDHLGGLVSLDLRFLKTRVETNPPYASAEVVPGVPSANAFAFTNSQGRASGTAVSSLGTFQVANASASVQQGTTVTAS